MENKINCSVKEPHSHLVHGMTFECEKGQDIDIVSMIKQEGKLFNQYLKDRNKKLQKERDLFPKKQNAFKQIGTRFGNAIRKLGER